jgi:hypothetical protein
MFVDRGQIDDAFRWLDKAYHQQTERVVWIAAGYEIVLNPSVVPLKHDPRYLELVRKVGLEE